MRRPHALALAGLLASLACGGGGGGGGPTDPGGNPDGDFAPRSDTTLSGNVSFDRVEIPTGVTVTVTADLVLTIAGPVEIAGRLAGDCVAIELAGAATVTITGSVSNACAELPPGSPPPLEITGDGEMTLEGAEIESSGSILVRNDPTLNGDARPSAGTLQAAQDGAALHVRHSLLRHVPGRAREGVPSLDARVPEPGADGSHIRVVSGGDVVLAGSTMYAQHGGDGGFTQRTHPTSVTARAREGGAGGDVRIVSSGGTIFVEESSEATTLNSGAGGPGGEAHAAVLGGTLEPLGIARAYGGPGGPPGAVTLWASEPLGLDGGDIEVVVGAAGKGGKATARGARGLDATADRWAGHGASALAVGGDGADATPLLWQGSDGLDFFLSPAVGAGNPALRGEGGSGIDGAGGDADAIAGNGGTGDCALYPDGGDGGDVLASGGSGGDGLFDPRDPTTPLDFEGVGGLAIHQGGNGGTGASCCESATAPGGPGGDGGDATIAAFLEKHGSEEVPARHGSGPGGRGTRGFGTAVTGYTHVGNGGRGGAPGMPGGAPGAFEPPSPGMADLLDPSFQPGAPGGECPPSKTALIEASPFKATVALGNVSGTCGFAGEWDGIEIVDGGDGLVTLRHDLFDRTLEFDYVYDESTGEATPPDGPTVSDAVTFDNGVTLEVELGACRAERASSSDARAPGLTGPSRTTTASSQSSCSATGGTYTLEQSVEQNASQLVLFFCSLVRVSEN